MGTDASEALSLSAARINYARARETPLESLLRLTVGSTPESPMDVAVGGRAEPKASLLPAVAHPVLGSNGQVPCWAEHSQVAGPALKSVLSCPVLRPPGTTQGVPLPQQWVRQ